MQDFRTIKLKNYTNVFTENTAAAAITPGMLIELTSSGTVRKHNSANTFAMPMFALENYLEGKTIEDAYATGDQVQVWVPGRGDEVYALLADGFNIAIGDALTSNGGGFLKKSDTDFQSYASFNEGKFSDRPIIGIALEAKDLTPSGSDSSAAGQYFPYIRIRIV
jgi:hypothetical protein